MATEHLRVPAAVSDWAAPATDWSSFAAPEVAPTPVNETLVEVANEMAPGKALDLGCGEGQNSLWLARHGWVVNAVDMSAGAISDAQARAGSAGATIVFKVADITSWRPVSRYDLVFCTLALPARGMGRGRMLEMAAAAVAIGGTILITELDRSLRREGWMAEKYLVSTDEIERYLDGFRITRSGVRATRHRHGYEERTLPVANVIATRRTDLPSRF